MPRSESALSVDAAFLHELWAQARSQLRAQLEQRAPEAVFLEGSIAEGFGNPRSDVDFVAIVDDGTKVATMPYILFLAERRVEVRLLSRERLVRELGELREELARGLPEPSTRISWNKLERCQRFMHCLPVHNRAYVEALQAELGVPALERIVSEWFRDFARETARHAVAMYALEQLDAAECWLKTSIFHAAKSYVARRGEHYLGSKWLAMQMERCGMDGELRRRLRELLFDAKGELPPAVYLERGMRLLADLEVDGVAIDTDQVCTGRKAGVTTWQIGCHVHVVRGADVFRLGRPAALAWRNVTFGAPCLSGLDAQRAPDAARRHKAYLADFARKGLLTLCWGEQPIRARHGEESRAVSFGKGPVISVDGARLVEDGGSDVQLLPLPAVRFAEAGVNLTWAHIGVENAREDSLGALRKQQWGVLEYTLQRLVQAACLVALAAHAVTPQPPLEEATLVATRLLQLDPALRQQIRTIETAPIGSELEAQARFALAEAITRELRTLAGETNFPASFDDEAGWCETILYGYDWFNVATHLDAPFPASAVGGRGTAEEARDLLASNLG